MMWAGSVRGLGLGGARLAISRGGPSRLSSTASLLDSLRSSTRRAGDAQGESHVPNVKKQPKLVQTIRHDPLPHMGDTKKTKKSKAKKKNKVPTPPQPKKKRTLASWMNDGKYAQAVESMREQSSRLPSGRIKVDDSTRGTIATMVKECEWKLATEAVEMCEVDIGMIMGALSVLPQTPIAQRGNEAAEEAIQLFDALRRGAVETRKDERRVTSYLLEHSRFVLDEFLADAKNAIGQLQRGRGTKVEGRLENGLKPDEVKVDVGYDEDTGRSAFINGDAVIIRRMYGPDEGEVLEELSVAVGRPLILRASNARAKNALMRKCGPKEEIRVEKLANRTQFSRLMKSLSGFANDKQSSKKGVIAPHLHIREAILTGKRALRAERTAFDCPPRLMDRSTRGLDPTQSAAVKEAMTERLTLIHGPPGTGKTKVAVATLAGWAEMRYHRKRNAQSLEEKKKISGSKILATSDSNVAVDNLLEGLANTDAVIRGNLRIVRLGQPENVRPELMKYCVDVGQMGGDKAAMYEAKVNALFQADIVCATCIGAGAELLDRFRFEQVLIDEAAQATESTCLVPMARGAAQLVLVGDQCQLPPTVISTDEPIMPLFTRLVETCSPALLATQYRMHPLLAEFANEAVYAGRLANGVPAAKRGFGRDAARILSRAEYLLDLEGSLVSSPFAFAHVDGEENSDGVSKANEAEADYVDRLVRSFVDGGVDPKQIAVITPYAAQVRAIRKRFRPASGNVFRRKRRHDGTDGPEPEGLAAVEVSSVDAIQGREKDVIIMSTVRSNSRGNVGFVSDWRRLNVSLTRAKKLAIVVGDARTLARERVIWRPFVAWALERGLANRAAHEALTQSGMMPDLKHDIDHIRSSALRRTPSLAHNPVATQNFAHPKFERKGWTAASSLSTDAVDDYNNDWEDLSNSSTRRASPSTFERERPQTQKRVSRYPPVDDTWKTLKGAEKKEPWDVEEDEEEYDPLQNYDTGAFDFDDTDLQDEADQEKSTDRRASRHNHRH